MTKHTRTRSSDYLIAKTVIDLLILLREPQTRYTVAVRLDCHHRTALRWLQMMVGLKLARTLPLQRRTGYVSIVKLVPRGTRPA
jgi:hypothetical protein